ncbi:MAG: hypothetical protein ACT4OU_08495 [Hyphomicrobium sp.]
MARIWAAMSAFAVTAALGAGGALSGPAINQFEVKDLQSAPGELEFQSQNAFSTGQPRRRFVQDPVGEFTYDDNTVIRQREALEIQLGITNYFRVRLGVEYEQERLDEPGLFADRNAFGGLQFDEVAIEGVFVFVKPKPDGVGLGLLVEYGAPVKGGSEEQSEVYIGPIIEAHSGPWSLIANLAFVKHMGGDAEPGDLDYVRDDKWDFSYFLQGQHEFSKSWALAIEAYGTIDRIGDSGNRTEEAELFGDMNQHRAGPVLYYTFSPHRGGQLSAASSNLTDDDDEKEVEVSIGAGALFGLNEHTPDTTYKLSVEVEY